LDHDPGHNGVGDGYGDLYPTNTPYLLTSQGSSGSDQPFMRALPFTLAAFRPEVKKNLIDTGLLMPTVQMILRSTNKHLANSREYLTGKAHPTGFEGAWVDPLRMVKLAHAIRADNIPPLVKLKVLEETRTVSGQDFFEPADYTEQHADTVAVVSRIWRGSAHRRRMVVSAEDSLDVNNKPLTFTWVVLRGDEKRIGIKPRNKRGSVAELTVSSHERRPVAPRSALESNRVDVGVFAHNGALHSAPGFVTFFSLDCEGRTYEEGKPVEIGYGMGQTELKVADPEKLFTGLASDGLAERIFRLSKDQRARLRKYAEEYRPLGAVLARARNALRQREADRDKAAMRAKAAEKRLAELRKKAGEKHQISGAETELAKARQEQKDAETKVQAARKDVTEAEAAANRFLDGARPKLKSSPRAFALEAVHRAARAPELWNKHARAFLERYGQPANAARRGRIDAARRKLEDLGIVGRGANKTLALRPARPGAGPAGERLTDYEKAMLEHFHAVALAELAVPGGVDVVFHTNFVDARLTTPKLWRDVYRPDGSWTRYRDGKVFEFTADGLLVTKKDDRGRPIQARTVVYKQDVPGGRWWVNPRPLRQAAGGEVVTFAYDGEKRKEASREKVLEGK
jgi:hypothetical protein